MATVKTSDAPVREPADRWSTAEAAELYDVASWGKGYFSVGSNGHLWVHPDKDESRKLDMKELVDNLQLRGISLPILVRFGEILKHRLGEMHQAFQNAKANTPHTARLAHDQALSRVMQALLTDDTQVYKQFVENDAFRRFIGDMVFGITQDAGDAGQPHA